ncbi:MAG: DUF2163 domain-containing protein [Pseudomonadota bacterium]
MSWFTEALETIALVWRLERRDGIALGFIGHDRDIWRQGFRYRAVPGIQPSAIMLEDGLRPDTMDIQGVIAHDAISETDLEAGRWNGARVAIGLADWADADRTPDWLVHGEIGEIRRRSGAFTAELQSGKAALEAAPCPRTSPSCRSDFGGHGCGLSRQRFRMETQLLSMDADGALIFKDISEADAPDYLFGHIRWLSGACHGAVIAIGAVRHSGLIPSDAHSCVPEPGDRALLTMGCDKQFTTCRDRFDNSANFRGEPHLPGNDLLTRYSYG